MKHPMHCTADWIASAVTTAALSRRLLHVAFALQKISNNSEIGRYDV
jgi:hypothetical protein